jgi:hypothetical protein
VPVNIIEGIVTEQQNTVTNFATLLVQEEKVQEAAREQDKSSDGKADIVSKIKDPVATDTTCKP